MGMIGGILGFVGEVFRLLIQFIEMVEHAEFTHRTIAWG
jgi:hypothetical protein